MSISPLIVEDMPQEELSKLFKVYKTLNKMMDDRGYEILNKEEIKFDSFIKRLKEEKCMSGIFTKLDKNDPNKKSRLYYHYIPTQKLNFDAIKDFIKLLGASEANIGLILISGKISDQAKRKLQEISNELLIEIFTLNELVVNITEHELVPKHILLSIEEKDALLKRYKIKESQLPKILMSDPVARYLGLKRGDVVKIVRVSETAGRYITYRIAI